MVSLQSRRRLETEICYITRSCRYYFCPSVLTFDILPAMEKTLKILIEALTNGEAVDGVWLEKLVRRRNREMRDGARTVAKRRLLPYYLAFKQNHPDEWASWGVSEAVDQALVALLRAKPRRSASGVATVTVLTKPWPCVGQCVFCPNDIRMPKSYLSDEPACQRAERCFFDPFLQVTARLRVLADMGHPIDKVELIVLGGTWSNYPETYQRWYMAELFRALDLFGSEESAKEEAKRREFYHKAGLTEDPNELAKLWESVQQNIDNETISYNEAVVENYNEPTTAWSHASASQTATLEDVHHWHRANERASCRCVGLVVETRPDLITVQHLRNLRDFGCTKIQMGIQTLRDDLLTRNGRGTSVDLIAHAFALLRLFGFKIHVHMMTNLVGATPQTDAEDYLRLVSDARFQPDEIKLYPCALVQSAPLTQLYETGEWVPYQEEALVNLLVNDVLTTPAYCRISRMIRDIPAPDILAGNKKTNLRQMVETRVEEDPRPVQEIRMREIATETVALDDLQLDEVTYETTVSQEYFLQWVTPQGKIAGFLRLSLPKPHAEAVYGDILPEKCAMIRELHVYGRVSRLGDSGDGAQHSGLGKNLVARARQLATDAGYNTLAVISAIGTREYYRNLGFQDGDLYQIMSL